MLTKHQIAARLEELELGKKNQMARVLDGLAQIAVEELTAGEDFTVPGVARISYGYRPKQSKGSRWRKGQERTGFGGVVSIAEEDSPPVTEQIKIAARVVGAVAKLKPKTTKEAQAEFLKTPTAKAVKKRKG